MVQHNFNIVLLILANKIILDNQRKDNYLYNFDINLDKVRQYHYLLNIHFLLLYKYYILNIINNYFDIYHIFNYSNNNHLYI